MRSSMQTKQGEVGHVRSAAPISPSRSEGQRARRVNRVPKNIAGATVAVRKTGSIGLLGSSVHYREDDVIGIAWCYVEF